MSAIYIEHPLNGCTQIENKPTCGYREIQKAHTCGAAIGSFSQTSQTELGNKQIRQAQLDKVQAFALSESRLSKDLGFRVSHLDVLVLMVEIMKLIIESRELERLSRREERDLQLKHMMEVVDNFKSQGKFMITAFVGGGAMMIFSGGSHFIGHMWGDPLKEALGSVSLFSAMKSMNKEDFTKGIVEMTRAMGTTYRDTGEIYKSYAESHRTYDQGYSDIFKTDADERTRSMDELLQRWRSMESFLSEHLRREYDVTRSAYGG
ncbi:MAG: hypothetical protein KDK55_00975 [Chlamydiia bacterium]|nr:hypothetical protein [Chlamydiia bacterium]